RAKAATCRSTTARSVIRSPRTRPTSTWCSSGRKVQGNLNEATRVHCHPERSEGSGVRNQILHFVQDDTGAGLCLRSPCPPVCSLSPQLHHLHLPHLDLRPRIVLLQPDRAAPEVRVLEVRGGVPVYGHGDVRP